MIDASQVVRAYRNVLLREPEADAVAALVRGAPDAAWVEAELRASVEHRTVVQPLRERLEAEWRQWALRAPTGDELRRGVDAARGRCGSDDAVRQAVADGSIARKLAFRPLKIEMDITNQCNLRCVMCHFSLPSYRAVPRQQISVPQFRSIAEQIFHRAAQVALSFGTEPLLHRELPALLAELQRHEVPHTYLHTNGLLLDERVVAAMVDTGFSVLFVSVDAATAATYEAIRVGGSWAKLRANLDLLARIKVRRGGHHPELTLGFVLQRENVAELPAFVELAAEVGATAVNATHMAVWDAVGNGPRGAHHDKAACNAALAEADRRARALGIELVAPPPFALAGAPTAPLATPNERARAFALTADLAPPGCCPFPWSFVAIEPDGRVLPCGWWDKQVLPEMGNIFTTPFLTIWHGERWRALRERHRRGERAGPCAHCPAAGMGDINAATSFLPPT